MTASRKRTLLFLVALLLGTLPILARIWLHWHDAPSATTLVHPNEADPDPWLRLTLVRDWLTGGSWYDHTMHASNAPWGGISSPWTRPLDMVLALVTSLQPDSVDLNLRLVRAGLLMPLLWAILTITGLTRALRMLNPIETAPVIAVAACIFLWSYYGAWDADHHALLTGLFIWAMGGVLTPAPSRNLALFTGFLFGLQLWVSPEALAIIGAVYVWYGLLWLFNKNPHDRTLPYLATAVAITSAVAVMVERPLAAWAVPVYDSISIVYVFLLGLAAILAWLLHTIQPRSFVGRMVIGAVGCIWLVAALAYTYPTMLHGPMAEADPFITETFMPSINEAMSPLTNPFLMLLSYLFQPLVAILFCALAIHRGNAILRDRSLFQWLFFFTFFTGLYFSQQRFYYYWHPFTVLMLAPMMAAFFTPENPQVRGLWPARWIGAKPERTQMLWRTPVMCIVLLLPMLLMAASDTRDGEAPKQKNSCQHTMREWIQTGALNDLGKGKPLNLLTARDVGGEVMFWTPHHIIASNYHREGVGMRYLRDAEQLRDAASLKRHLAARQVDALLLCPATKPVEGSLLDAIAQGATPPRWLKPIEIKGASEHTPVLLMVRH